MGAGRNINYKNIAYAIDYYTKNGFQYVEVPWLVPPSITKVTFDAGKAFRTKQGDLVGSAEQSFIHLTEQGISKGAYVAVTPCFREETIDYWHGLWFMKVELFDSLNVREDRLDEIVGLCKVLYQELLGEKVELVETDEGYDLNCKGIELGSYGIRKYKDFSWIYATGLAEPRFSMVKNLDK